MPVNAQPPRGSHRPSRHAPGGRQRDIKPLDPPMVPFAVGGIITWAVAGLVLLGFRGTLAEHGHESWLWICLAGFLLGFPGLAIMLTHDSNRRRRRAVHNGSDPR